MRSAFGIDAHSRSRRRGFGKVNITRSQMIGTSADRLAKAGEALEPLEVRWIDSAAMDSDDASLLIPIGHCIGAYYDLPASTEHFIQVRVGADVNRLSDEQFVIWGPVCQTPDDELFIAEPIDVRTHPYLDEMFSRGRQVVVGTDAMPDRDQQARVVGVHRR